MWLQVAFRMPDLAEGEYAVWVCRKECGANSGFGDLVYGSLRVASADEGSRAAVDSDSAWLSVLASVVRTLGSAAAAASTLPPSPTA